MRRKNGPKRKETLRPTVQGEGAPCPEPFGPESSAWASWGRHQDTVQHKCVWQKAGWSEGPPGPVLSSAGPALVQTCPTPETVADC